MSESDETTIIKKAQECVEYILFCVMAERKAIFKRTDLHKTILKDHVKLSKPIMKQTQKFLDEVFGLELIDMDGPDDVCEKYGVRSKFEFDPELFKKDSCLIGGNDTMRATISSDQIDESDRAFDEQMKYGLLLIALSLIFMNDNEMDADLFWDSLKRIDINKDEKKHKYLGDVSKFFCTDLVREGYLEYEKLRNVDPPQYKFKWGQRAKLEIPKMNVLRFVCEMYGGMDVCKPEEWLAQFKDACKPDIFNEGMEQQQQHNKPIQQVVELSFDTDTNVPPPSTSIGCVTRAFQRLH